MGLFLEAACKRKIWKQIAGKEFEHTAYHYKRHGSCLSLCLRSSKLIPISTLCRGFSSLPE
jgi:hypothetical protein